MMVSSAPPVGVGAEVLDFKHDTNTFLSAMGLFFQQEIRRRCIPHRNGPATDLVDVIRRRGTIAAWAERTRTRPRQR